MIREQTTPSAALSSALQGALIGDALGRPAHGLSHHNVRTYYKGIKEMRDDEKRGGAAGTGTAHAQRLRCAAHALEAGTWPDAGCTRHLPPDTSDAAVLSVALAAQPGALAALDLAPEARAAAQVHAWAITYLLECDPAGFDATDFWSALQRETARAERQHGSPGALSARLDALTPHLDEFPLDLQDRCGGTGDAPDQAWAFSVAMFARNPLLVEATLLSAINVGGAAATVGALVGSLLGALHGPEAFPAEWREEVGRFAGW